MADFKLFEPLFDKVDTATASFVSDISSNAIATVTPFVTAGLTLSFITYAILIIRGTVDMPILDFLGRAIRISLVAGVALAGGIYQSDLAGVITALPNDMAVKLISDPVDGSTAANLIDNAAEKGFTAAGKAFQKAGFFEDNGLIYGLFGIIIMLATAVFVAIGGAFVLLAKVALALLAGLGPLFILGLLWPPTVRFFEMWLGQVINYGLVVVLFSAVFGFMVSIYTGFVGGIKFEEGMNIAYSLGGSLILSVAMILILLQIPSIASGLAGGVSMGYVQELSNFRRGANQAGRAGRGAWNTGKAAASRAAPHMKTAATKVGTAASAGAQKAYGYFKGRAA